MCMAILTGKKFELVEDMTTAEDTTPLEAGDVYEVTADPAEYDRVNEECIELVHENNADLPEDTHPVKPIVVREEFIDKTVDV